MTTPSRSPVLRLIRYMIPAHVKVYAVFWTVLLLVWAAGVAFVSAVGTIETSLVAIVNLVPPKWFLFVITILIAAVELPTYVAHGVTRRDVCLASLAMLSATAFGFGLLTLGMFGLESATFRLIGVDGLNGALPVSSGPDALRLVGEASLLYLLWAAWGWLVGAGYYRFGAWRGTLFLAPAGLPVLIGELAMNGDNAGSGLASLAPGAAAALTVAATLLALLGAFVLVRDVPIRKVSG